MYAKPHGHAWSSARARSRHKLQSVQNNVIETYVATYIVFVLCPDLSVTAINL